MGYVTPEQIAQAKEWDLLTYLQWYDPYRLVYAGGSTYYIREHDSSKISNGKWNWFSRKIGGKTVLDYLIKVQGFSFTEAVEAPTGPNFSPPSPALQARPKEQEPRKLVLPQPNWCAIHAVSYLYGRGIDYGMIDHCIQIGCLYESLLYHNAVFVGRDQQGQPHYVTLRGIIEDFKGEATDSDKWYSFAITEDPATPNTHLFEPAIDPSGYATLLRMKGRDWRQDAIFSLGGVFKRKQESVILMTLNQYLQDHPSVYTLCLRLDNDEVGRDAAVDVTAGLGDRYEALDRLSSSGKDINDLLLQWRLRQTKRKGEWSWRRTIRA